MKKNMAKENIIEILEKHLPYEVWMMRSAKAVLEAEITDQWFYNTVHESFFLHARNLVEFLRGEEDFHPAHFTKGWKAPGAFSQILTKINSQIQHLGDSRTMESAKKLGISDIRAAADWIEKELSKLRSMVAEEWEPHWKVPDATPSPVLIVTARSPSATNAIEAAGSTYGANRPE